MFLQPSQHWSSETFFPRTEKKNASEKKNLKLSLGWSLCGHFVVTLWSPYGHFVVTFWSPNGHLMVTFWSPFGHLLVTELLATPICPFLFVVTLLFSVLCQSHARDQDLLIQNRSKFISRNLFPRTQKKILQHF
jgi:hypothetical protein